MPALRGCRVAVTTCGSMPTSLSPAASRHLQQTPATLVQIILRCLSRHELPAPSNCAILVHETNSLPTSSLAMPLPPKVYPPNAAEVIQPEDAGAGFRDVGALAGPKAALREAVQLPLQHPALFMRGPLARPCRGVLLFGPPGEGCIRDTSHVCWHHDEQTALRDPSTRSIDCSLLPDVGVSACVAQL